MTCADGTVQVLFKAKPGWEFPLLRCTSDNLCFRVISDKVTRVAT